MTGLAATCVNHPQAATEERCARCGRPFCGDCLVELLDQRFCAGCRDQHVRGLQRSVELDERAAREALIWSLCSFLCFVLAPVGLFKGLRALQRFGPARGAGRVMAIAAIALSCLVLLGYAAQIIITALQFGRMRG